MQTSKKNPDPFDEEQSLRVIREMIQVSQKKIKNDGILFIIWGWAMFYNYLSSWVLSRIVTTYTVKKGFRYFGTTLGILAILFSVYYLFRKGRKVKTYIETSLRYVWISLFICLSLTGMIIQNVIHEVRFELQHPVFMMFIAFAIVITGGIIRYRLIIIGGIIFGVLAYTCSYFELEWQMLFEAGAWLIAFIIPGHLLYSQRNS